MQLVSFVVGGAASYGVIDGDAVRPVAVAFRERFANLREVLAAGAAAAMPEHLSGDVLAASDVSFLPPVPNPDKILCVGVNYRPHIEEMGRDVPEYPVVFVRFPGSLVGHDEPVRRPRVSEQFDYEGELAIVIGRSARHVPRARALDIVAGYSCFLDGSVRDWQRHTMQFTPGKNFQDSGAMGPALVTAESVGDPRQLRLTTSVNGETMQTGRLADLVFDIPRLIEYCSTFARLEPGDIIATGTPGGVGAARTPPRWLQAGDTVEVEVPGVGLLSNHVWDELPTSEA